MKFTSEFATHGNQSMNICSLTLSFLYISRGEVEEVVWRAFWHFAAFARRGRIQRTLGREVELHTSKTNTVVKEMTGNVVYITVL